MKIEDLPHLIFIKILKALAHRPFKIRKDTALKRPFARK
jgi:hypothetical protein